MKIRHIVTTLGLLAYAAICSAQPTEIDPGTLCPPITPAWAFGHIVWEDSINTRRGAEMLVNGYLERGYPVDAVIIDTAICRASSNDKWIHGKRGADHPVADWIC